MMGRRADGRADARPAGTGKTPDRRLASSLLDHRLGPLSLTTQVESVRARRMNKLSPMKAGRVASHCHKCDFSGHDEDLGDSPPVFGDAHLAYW